MKRLLISALLALPIGVTALTSLPAKASALDIIVRPSIPVATSHRVWVAGHWDYRAGRRYWVPGHYDYV